MHSHNAYTRFIAIPADTTIETPIHIRYPTEPSSSSDQAFPHLHLSIGRNSSVHLIETCASEGACATHLTVDIEEGGTLIHTYMGLTPFPGTSSCLHATVRNNGSLFSSIAASTPLFSHSASIALVEPGANATLRGLSALCSSHQSSFNICIDHLAPHTSSSQLFKAIVAEKGSGSFESRVSIHKQAQKSEAHQHSHFLTLGDRAQTRNKPCFDIFADDVIATHGATCGTVDEEALFYLASRGLSRNQGRRYLIEGFCEEFIRVLPSTERAAFSRCILDILGDEL